MTADGLRAKVRRAKEITEVARVARQRERVEDLEAAVREMALLHDGLRVVLDDLEQALVPALEGLHGDR